MKFFRDENEEEEEEDPKRMSKGWVLETIRQKKEAIIRLRSQPWSMKRKRRALKYASNIFLSFFFCFKKYRSKIYCIDCYLVI